jgi:hypothetical protein
MSEHQDMTKTNEPTASRPRTPGPGYGVPESDEGLLPWSDVNERLREARNYWIATANQKARPHAAPTWGVWIDQIFYTEGGGRKIRNLRANPEVVVHLESGDQVVIIEGVASEISKPERSLFERIDAGYASKYGYKPSVNLSTPDDIPYPEGGLFAIRPSIVFAWTRFPEDATRYTFDLS